LDDFVTLATSGWLPAYHLVLVLLSLAGCTYSHFFFTAVVLDILRAPAGRSVVTAVYEAAPHLQRVSAVVFCFVFVYGIVAFLAFRPDLEGSCDTPFQVHELNIYPVLFL
jgi:hypothetical protein